MSLFDKYRPYLYDTLEESQREKLGLSMFTHLTTLTSNPENGGVPNVYLGTFTKEEMGFVGDLFNKFVPNEDYNKGVDYNKEILNDIVAGYALNNLWGVIQRDYGSEEKIRAAIVNKQDRVPQSLAYFQENGNDSNNGLTEYLKIFDNIGIKINILSMGADLSTAFDTLFEFSNLLAIPPEQFAEAKRRQALELLASSEKSMFTKSMLGVLVALYESGFTGFPQEGLILYNSNGELQSPITRVRQSKIVTKSIKGDNGLGNDLKIATTLTGADSSLNRFCMLSENKEGYVPDVSYFLSMYEQRQSFVCPNLHLMFQSADITYSKGSISINNWIKETKKMTVTDWKEKCNGGKNILQKWSDVLKWYEWALNTLFIDALMEYNDNGVILQGRPNELSIYTKVASALINGIANVVVVSERDNKKYSKTELRVASQTLKTEGIITSLDGCFNVAGMTTTSFERIKSSSNYVSIVRVVYDEKEANKGNLFAGDVIDSFIESGNVPSWSHALIGKKEDGSLFFWDGFMDPGKAGPSNRCYTIYAGSRSGKGIMTSTLIASALADGKEVFYTDGKPENGPSLGMIAWEKGKEAYVFDGQKSGQAPFAGAMESYTYDLRKATDIYASLQDLKRIPELFGKTLSNDDVQVYLGVMRYLKSLMLCVDIIEGRSSQRLPMDNWQIWVFDEMTSMSSNERKIREKFADYCSKKGVAFSNGATKKGETPVLANLALTHLKDKDMINPASMKFDAGIKFIIDWCAWNDSLAKKMLKANVISLGKANTNMIFIFQEPTWIPADCRVTTIAKIVNMLKSTKIAGRGGIQDGCNQYGDGTIKADWKTKINIEGAGNWVMSDGADIRTSKVTLFKPFNIYTVPNQKNAKDRKVPDGIPATNYLAGYTEKLLGHFGMDTASVIESAYTYADNAVRDLGMGQSLKGYIYNASDFTINGSSDLDELYAAAIAEMKAQGIDVSQEQEQYTQNSGASGTFTASSEDEHTGNPTSTDTPPSAVPSGDTSTSGATNPIVVPPTSQSSDGDTSPMGDNGFTPHSQGTDPRLEGVFETFDPQYTKIINVIENKVDDLRNIPSDGKNVERNSINFKKLQREILRNFDADYLIAKNKFIADVKKVVTEDTLLSITLSHYEEKFTQDFGRLKTEVTNLTFGGGSANPDYSDTSDVDGFTPPGSGTEDAPYQVPPERVNQPPVAREKPRPVNQYAGRRLDAPIDTGNLTFDLDEYENEGSRGPLKDSKNVKVAMQLVQLITKDIKRQFGGSGEIEEITITAGGGLVLNGFAYMPQFDDALIQSMPQTKQVYYQNGDLAKVVNIGAVVDNIMDNVFMLSIESPSVANSEVFQNEIGVKNYNYSKLFRRMSNLQTIILPDGELTRNGPQEVGQTGLGLGAKLAGIFGFGKGKKDSQGYVPNPSPTSNRDSMTDRIFESKPVKVMAGALGWTLGCKAVVMAATIFGPWGLLFGAFAAAGAYKEIKNGNNQRNSQSQRRDNRSGGQNRNNQGRNNQGRNQNKQNKQGNGGFSQNYSSQGRPPRNNNNDEDWY